MTHALSTLEHILDVWFLRLRCMTAAAELVRVHDLDPQLLEGIGDVVREGEPDTRDPRVIALIDATLDKQLDTAQGRDIGA